MTENFLIGKSAEIEAALNPAFATRHGLISGATGTGKTITLQALAEQFSQAGIPVFLADVKGDLAGLMLAGGDSTKVKDRLRELGLVEHEWRAFPVAFWDVFGQEGLPLRATISDVGPLLLGRLLRLNDVQQGVLSLAFKVADDHGLLLLDLKDLRAIIRFVADNASDLRAEYGNVSQASVGAIQRSLLSLEEQGAEHFFGEPMLRIDDLMRRDTDGRAFINILAAKHLFSSPSLYGTVLLWLLSEIYENLPEVGDLFQPKLVLFFDEAHILFDEAPKILREKIEQVVRLVRSKGVGVFFVTQNPLDVPEEILGQLGNRIHHALRAFTARDQKAVRAAAETLPINDKLDCERALTELAVGEALVSFLDNKGKPTPVERVFIIPPRSAVGSVSENERNHSIENHPLRNRYLKTVDRDSAYEMLQQRFREDEEGIEESPARSRSVLKTKAGEQKDPKAAEERKPAPQEKESQSRSNRQSPFEALVKSTLRAVGSELGRNVMRGILGSMLGSGSRKR